MGEKDITEKILEDYNDVFADIVNVLLFNGKEVVKEDSLENSGVHSGYKADDSKVHEQERDIAKFWREGNVRIALHGIENQTTVDKLMPFRIISYDGSSYKSQMALDEENMLPVITIVLYFGKTRWNSPKSLKESLSIPRELNKYVNDYKIHVFEIAWLSEKQVNMFKSDFKLVADFFVKSRINPNYMPTDKTEIKHIEEVLKLLSVVTGDKRYEDVIISSKVKEVHNMCEVADRLWNGGKAEGVIEGKAEAYYSLVQDGDISVEKAAEKLEISVEEFEKRMEKAGYKIPELV